MEPEPTESKRPDLIVSTVIALANVIAHVVWHPIQSEKMFALTAVLFTTVTSLWLAKQWRRLTLFLTKFYCVAAVFDLLSEGILQPFHHDTKANIICTGTMFGVFLVYWLILRPIELRYFLPPSPLSSRTKTTP